MKESGQMYLKDIYLLSKKNTCVKSIDIAKDFGYSKASVSRGVSLLKKSGMITVSDSGNITLTTKGVKEAVKIHEKCSLISDFLCKTLEIDKIEACKNSCLIEHVITDKCLQAIETYLERN